MSPWRRTVRSPAVLADLGSALWSKNGVRSTPRPRCRRVRLSAIVIRRLLVVRLHASRGRVTRILPPALRERARRLLGGPDRAPKAARPPGPRLRGPRTGSTVEHAWPHVVPSRLEASGTAQFRSDGHTCTASSPVERRAARGSAARYRRRARSISSTKLQWRCSPRSAWRRPRGRKHTFSELARARGCNEVGRAGPGHRPRLECRCGRVTTRCAVLVDELERRPAFELAVVLSSTTSNPVASSEISLIASALGHPGGVVR